MAVVGKLAGRSFDVLAEDAADLRQTSLGQRRVTDLGCVLERRRVVLCPRHRSLLRGRDRLAQARFGGCVELHELCLGSGGALLLVALELGAKLCGSRGQALGRNALGCGSGALARLGSNPRRSFRDRLELAGGSRRHRRCRLLDVGAEGRTQLGQPFGR